MLPLPHSAVLRDVQDKGRFSHGRSGCNQDQICRLKSCCLAVQVREAGRNTGNVAADLGCHDNLAHRIGNNLPDILIFRPLIPL